MRTTEVIKIYHLYANDVRFFLNGICINITVSWIGFVLTLSFFSINLTHFCK